MNTTTERLTIDDEHVYRLNGRVIPSVTQILKDVGLINHWNCDPWYLERGQAAHLAIHYFLDGDLKEASVDPAIKGYLEAFKNAQSEIGFHVLESERMVFDDVRWYAGTMDLVIGRAKTAELGKPQEVWDIKTGAFEKWHGYQTAAYAGARFKSAARYYKRGGLYLQSDGKFKLVPHNAPDDYNIFYSAVNIYHAKRK